MAYNRLLAKSPSQEMKIDEGITLPGHTLAVIQVAYKLIHILAPGLKESIQCENSDVKSWKLAVSIAAWIHDWGKANDHFQKMLRNPGFKQGVRHEILSFYIIQLLEEWLAPLWNDQPRWFKSAVLFSCLGHHLKYPDPVSEGQRPGTEAYLHIDHPDFNKVLTIGHSEFSLSSPPKLKSVSLSLLSTGILKKTLKRLIQQLVEGVNEKELILIAATKTTLMCADLAGSALPKKVQDIDLWLDERLGQNLHSDQLKNMISQKLGSNKPRVFQEEVVESKTRTTLLDAGCGSGKTAAAYLWASKNAHMKRVFFCYPTTGTASEGYIGYLKEPDFEGLLIHSRAKADYRLMSNMPKPRHEENENLMAGLEALDTWPVPAVVCTAHTVLGLLENVRRGLYAWPSIVRAAFVFDEIHAYSDKLFTYLLRFLETFTGAPVLLMTATLPRDRKLAIKKCSKIRGGITVVQGPREREESNRYILSLKGIDLAWKMAKICLSRGGKVLWIVNTVKRAMDTTEKALLQGLPIQPYHSRYSYRDRLKRHRTVIDGFIPNGPAMLAVTTQVAEMSLDLSADLLVSEYAPIPSLIQRLGRLNRFHDCPEECKEGVFIEPESILPYDEEQLTGLAEWFDSVADGFPKSQRDLANAFVDLSLDSKEPIQRAYPCDWLERPQDSGTDRKHIEESGFTIEIIREEELGTASPVEIVIPMPMPKSFDILSCKRQGRFFISPKGSMEYDSFKGAQWKQ